MTVIRYQLPAQSEVTLKLHNVLVQVVKTLVDQIEQAGYKSIEWNSSGVASGVYFYRLQAVGVGDPSRTFTQVKKMLLIK